MKKLLTFGCLMLAVLLTHAAIPLAKDGKPAAEILLDSTASPLVRHAAGELQYWIRKISGAKLPVATTVNPNMPAIYLTLDSKPFAEDFSRLCGPDGYAVRQKGNTVYLISPTPKGILNGVYRLLYRNSDIIWARPNPEFGTVFTPSPNLQLTQVDYQEHPGFAWRGWQINAKSNTPTLQWLIRHGINWSKGTSQKLAEEYGLVKEIGGSVIGAYLKPAKYLAEHPEFYSMQKGKRLNPESSRTSVQLCLSNPEVLKCFLVELEEKFKTFPGIDNVYICIEDNLLYCRCPECMKPVELPGERQIPAKDPAFQSTRFFLWLNRVGQYLKEKHPKKRIRAYAYLYTEIPPHCAIESNIDILYCPIDRDSRYPVEAPENAETAKHLDQWLSLTPNIVWREYYGLASYFPRPMDAAALSDFRYIRKHQVTGTFSELAGDSPDIPKFPGDKCWDANMPYFWVMTAGLWDPDSSLEALRGEFFRRTFGAGAEDVAEYHRLIDEQWLKNPLRSVWNDNAHFLWNSLIVKTGITEACRAALERAAGKVTHPNARIMLDRLRSNFEESVGQAKTMEVRAAKVNTPPQFAPELDRFGWEQAVPADCFLLYTGLNTGEPFPEKTELRMLYDRDNLYVGIKCSHRDIKNLHYPPKTNSDSKRPAGEYIGLLLCGVNHQPKQYLRIILNPGNDHLSDGNWTSQARIIDSGWSAMITIPWQELQVKPEDAKLTVHCDRTLGKPAKALTSRLFGDHYGTAPPVTPLILE